MPAVRQEECAQYCPTAACQQLSKCRIAGRCARTAPACLGTAANVFPTGCAVWRCRDRSESASFASASAPAKARPLSAGRLPISQPHPASEPCAAQLGQSPTEMSFGRLLAHSIDCPQRTGEFARSNEVAHLEGIPAGMASGVAAAIRHSRASPAMPPAMLQSRRASDHRRCGGPGGIVRSDAVLNARKSLNIFVPQRRVRRYCGQCRLNAAA